MPNFRRKLAVAIANLHKIEVPGIEQTPLFEKAFADASYFKTFDDKCNEKIYTPEEQLKIDEIKTSSSVENKEFLNKILPKDDIVFSHNDLLAGNILVNKDNLHVILIDYEYADPNFRGFDIGNMFKESIFDYTHPEAPYFKVVEDYFPKEEELREFLQYYIAFQDMTDAEQKENFDKFIADYDLLREHIQKKYKEKELEKRITKLFNEVKIGVMLSHYYWMNWGIKKAKVHECDFDYITFSHTKFSHYKKLKNEFQAVESN